MLKKATSFLSKLNTFCIVTFIICFVIVRLDIMPDDFSTVLLWTGYISAGVTLLFIISVLILTLKEKKLQTDFGFVVTYFLDAVFISFVGWFVYMVLNTPIF
jgi:hypothetical protein